METLHLGDAGPARMCPALLQALRQGLTSFLKLDHAPSHAELCLHGHGCAQLDRSWTTSGVRLSGDCQTKVPAVLHAKEGLLGRACLTTDQQQNPDLTGSSSVQVSPRHQLRAAEGSYETPMGGQCGTTTSSVMQPPSPGFKW